MMTDDAHQIAVKHEPTQHPKSQDAIPVGSVLGVKFLRS